MINLNGISKSYFLNNSALPVLNDINLTIEDGEMTAIMGPSGSGKTTLLNIIGCLDRPSAGSYFLNGREVSSLSRGELAAVRGHQIGFVFQSFNLLPYLSALANVELGLTYAGGGDRANALEALAEVGLADRVKHRPNQLSGGERQRVAIARALVKKPPLILADEPTGNLDSRSGEEVVRILTEFNRNRGVTLVVVTHNYDIARQCRRIIHMKDGRIEAEENVA